MTLCILGLVAKLDKPEEAKQVVSDMTELRDLLVKPANLKVHLSTNTKVLDKPQEPWLSHMLPKGVATAGER